uniref:Uncharacterized protein n=1 Tax=Arundo donax TaxID=35708 RepID=A0A0A9AQF4_ARUDO
MPFLEGLLELEQQWTQH